MAQAADAARTVIMTVERLFGGQAVDSRAETLHRSFSPNPAIEEVLRGRVGSVGVMGLVLFRQSARRALVLEEWDAAPRSRCCWVPAAVGCSADLALAVARDVVAGVSTVLVRLALRDQAAWPRSPRPA